jgi:hypothetical protein
MQQSDIIILEVRMEILAFILCFVVFGFFILTIDFKNIKISDAVLVFLIIIIISAAGLNMFLDSPEPYDVPMPYPTSTPSILEEANKNLTEINEKLDKIEKNFHNTN